MDEALRYLGAHAPDDGLRAAAEQIARQVTLRFVPRYVIREYDVRKTAEGVVLEGSGVTLPGRLAARMLAECERAAVVVCTLGATFDRWLAAEQRRSMADAVIVNACGSAWVEAGCDAAEDELRRLHPGLYLTDRFSPGYGDLPLTVQGQMLAAADAGRRLGVVLTPSCLMNPTKTVTAVIGLSERQQMARIRGCAFCRMKETCTLRERGDTCGV